MLVGRWPQSRRKVVRKVPKRSCHFIQGNKHHSFEIAFFLHRNGTFKKTTWFWFALALRIFCRFPSFFDQIPRPSVQMFSEASTRRLRRLLGPVGLHGVGEPAVHTGELSAGEIMSQKAKRRGLSAGRLLCLLCFF